MLNVLICALPLRSSPQSRTARYGFEETNSGLLFYRLTHFVFELELAGGRVIFVAIFLCSVGAKSRFAQIKAIVFPLTFAYTRLGIACEV